MWGWRSPTWVSGAFDALGVSQMGQGWLLREWEAGHGLEIPCCHDERDIMWCRDLPCCCAGTPHYMSPEVITRRPYTFASDMWALGAVLYEMAARRPAFDARGLPQVCVVGRRAGGWEWIWRQQDHGLGFAYCLYACGNLSGKLRQGCRGHRGSAL